MAACGVCMSVVTTPVEGAGLPGDELRAGEAALGSREEPEGPSHPLVCGAARDEGAWCQPPGRGWGDLRCACP